MHTLYLILNCLLVHFIFSSFDRMSSSMEKIDLSKLRALVVGQGGEDHGKYSTGVKCEWIKNFNYEEWLNADPDDEDFVSYVIEWRNTLQPPAGGWEVYNGMVLEVAGKQQWIVSQRETLIHFWFCQNEYCVVKFQNTKFLRLLFFGIHANHTKVPLN